MHALQYVASTASPGLLQALGIDWKLLIEQAFAFCVLLFILSKFVYPVLIKSIDARRSQIEAGIEEAKEAQAALEKAEAKVAEMLAVARGEADDILARSHKEATDMVVAAEDKAKTRAEQIVSDARAQLAVDISKARAAIKRDTIQLVALATEKIIKEKLDDRKDAHLINEALQEHK
jgi:F-type H+-transporting ATPase subunit b